MKTKIILFLVGVAAVLICEAAEPPPGARSARESLRSGSGGQPIVSTGNREPSEAEAAEVLEMLRGSQSRRERLREIEKYIERQPDSPFAVSLHSMVALENRGIGRYTAALEHWDAVSRMVRSDEAGSAKVIFDSSLVHYTSLLASLGRTEELGELVRNYRFRIMARPHLAEVWAKTLEAYQVLRKNPAIAYRCGTYALNTVSHVLHNKPFAGLWTYGSGANGFTLAELQQFSDDHNLGLVAAVRQSGTELIVPAVVHWKQNHYAAIKRREGERILVIDPTFLHPVWMDLSTIEEEASGYFLVPRSATLPRGWRVATAEESKLIFGKGYPQIMDDDSGSGCTLPPPCCDEQGPPGTGSGDGPCGMPTWSVQEPQINLMVTDIPLAYEAAFGPDFVVRLVWRARSTGPLAFSNFSEGWESDLVSFITSDQAPTGNEMTFDLRSGNGATYHLHFAQGATISEPDHLLGIRAVRTINIDNEVTAFTVYYRNGATEYYTNAPLGFFPVSARTDATGQKMTFIYENPEGPLPRLKQIKLADGAEFDFAYTNESWIYAVTKINGPGGRSAKFGYVEYDPTPGDPVLLLASITDAEGIVSSFQYDPENRWRVTSMTTPYGATTFETYAPAEVASCYDGENLACDGIDRSLLVTEPDGGKHLFLFYDNEYGWTFEGVPGQPVVTNAMAGKIPASFGSSQIPSYPATNVPPIQKLDTIRDRRNSHYWGRLQTTLLSTANFAFTNLANLTSNDYKLSRTRHWLAEKALPEVPGRIRTLSWELPGSQDGVNEGLPVFRDYPGKEENWHEGSSDFPAVISQRMPDGSTRYTYFERNTNGMATSRIEAWGEMQGTNQVWSWRTNTFQYASSTNMAVDGLLLLKEVGPGGHPVFERGLHATHSDQIGSETNAGGNHVTFDYDTYRRLTKRETEAGLISIFNYYPTNTANSSNRLKEIVEYIGSTNNPPLRTNAFTWEGGYLKTNVDARKFVRVFTFDKLGRIKEIAYPGDGTTETFSYVLTNGVGFNSSGTNLPILDLVTYKDRMGNLAQTIPNRVRQVQRIREPSKTTPGEFGTEHWIDYCGCGSPTTITNGANTASPQIVNLAYNKQGAVTNISLSGLSITTHYDLLGRAVRREDGLTTVTNRFDNLNRLIERRNAGGLLVGLGYDAENNLVAWTSSAGVLVTNAYDSAGRLLARGFPDGGLEKWVYNANGFDGAAAYTNQLGKATTWAYDALQRLTNETTVGVHSIKFSYSPADDLRELRDGKDQLTSWGYDAEGRVIGKTNHLGTNVVAYTYDANSRMTNRVTPAKGTTTYTYDRVGNLTLVNYPSSPDITLQYDGLGRLTNMVDAVSVYDSTKFIYDAAGRLLAEDGPWSGDTVSYGYSGGRRTSLTLAQPYSSAWVQSYGYDAAGRLANIVSSAGVFQYLLGGGSAASDLIKRLILPNGAYVTNTFDSVGRLAGTYLNSSAHSTLNSHAYLVNQGDQRYKQTFNGANYVDYNYDDAGQLVAALGKENGGGNRFHEQVGYGYDAAGNLLTRTNYQLIQSFTLNGLNQLSNVVNSGTLTVAGFTTTNASVTVNGGTASVYNDGTFSRSSMSLTNTAYTAVATDGTGRSDTNTIQVNLPGSVSFQYDQNGNLTSDGLRSFDYDDENQLIRVRESNWMSEFVCDAFGRRRITREYANATFLSVGTLSSTLRNDHHGWVGFHFTLGSSPVTVTELGRWVVSGNTASHAIKLVRVSDGTEVSGALTTVQTSGASPGQFLYGALPAPVTLSANTSYYLLSQEVSGGDYWYDYNSTLSSSIATIHAAAWGYTGSTNYATGGGTGNGFVPVNFRYVSGTYAPVSETRYIYDGVLPIQERDENNVPIVTYTRGLDLSGTLQGAGGIGGLLARTDNTLQTIGSPDAHAYYHADGSGNVTMLLNSQQFPVAKYHYDPFGNTLTKAGPLAEANTYRFSSKEIHAASGLYYYGFRVYDPNLQRWLNQDPIGESGGLNLFQSNRNSPVNMIDPFGQCGWQFTDAFGKPLPMPPTSGPSAEELEIWGAIAGVVLEPLDWVMTAREIFKAPKSAASYAGLIPFVPSGIGKAAKAIGRKTPEPFPAGTRGGSSPEGSGGGSSGSGGGGGGGSGGGTPDPNKLVGHGSWFPHDSPETVLPDGTSLTVWGEHGTELSGSLGLRLQMGLPVDLKRFPEAAGAQTYLPGAVVPNYTLHSPTDLPIIGNPTIVAWPTKLNHLLKPSMGNVNWIACRVADK